MNVISLVGRLTKDPELKFNSQNVAYCRFDLAVDNSYKDKDGNKVDSADFISCVCRNKTAENLSQYMKKGNRIGLSGRLHTYSYDKEDGSKGYSYDVVVNGLEYLESKPKDSRPEPTFNGIDVPAVETSSTIEEDPYAAFGNEVDLKPEDLPF